MTRPHVRRHQRTRLPARRRRRDSPTLACLLLASLATLLLSGARSAAAHESSTSYLRLQLDHTGALSGSLEIGVTDLFWSLIVDSDESGRIFWKDIEAARPQITSLVTNSLTVRRGSAPCTLGVIGMHLTHHLGEPFVAVAMTGHCTPEGPLTIHSSLFVAVDAGHRTLLDVRMPDGSGAGSRTSGSGSLWSSAGASLWTAFAACIVQGIWHVWTGYDHLAFLLSLLLPCALTAAADGWRPTTGLRPVMSELLRVVTMFTAAHSITLALSTLQLISVRARIIEPLIAATIVIAALLNLTPRAATLRVPVAFGFGLVHGCGFALALRELAPAKASLLALLAGFNTGVELAQLSLVIAVAPALVLLRHSSVYATRLMPALSLGVALAGFAWLGARVS